MVKCSLSNEKNIKITQKKQQKRQTKTIVLHTFPSQFISVPASAAKTRELSLNKINVHWCTRFQDIKRQL